MDFVKIRDSLGISQEENAVLFGTSVTNIREWEKGKIKPCDTALVLYKLVSDKDQCMLDALIFVACQKKYTNLKDVQYIKELISKIVKLNMYKAVLGTVLLKSNSHWKPEEMDVENLKISL
jgi:predicted transcriptional regulator